MIIGIVAVDRNGAIGKGGQLPWHYSEDMKHFKETTLHHACVMGRKTWLTLKKPLVDRTNIVLSRESNLELPNGVVLFRSVESVLEFAGGLKCDLFVIGGEQLYRSFLPHIDKWIVTHVPLAVEGADAFVPSNYLNGFSETGSKTIGDGLIVRYYEKETM